MVATATAFLSGQSNSCVWTYDASGKPVSVTCTVPPPLPAVACEGSWSAPEPVGEWSAWAADPARPGFDVRSRATIERYAIKEPAQYGGSPCEAVDGAQRPGAPITESRPTPAPSDPIFGAVTPEELGQCTAAQHDRYVVRAGDGTLYRTWHPQREPSGCYYGHEHGDNPATSTDAEIRAAVVPFGFIVNRTPGHPMEPHFGYKCFVANPGLVNDENRRNLVYSRSCFHMGTGGPARFTQPHHSADVFVKVPNGGFSAHTQLMMRTGGFAGVCDPRVGINKDGLVLGTCKVNSTYEIWTTDASVLDGGGREVYRAFATPAVFDPITGFNPANPTEVVYATTANGLAADPRINALLNFPNNSRTHFKGCDRENYAQPGYWYNRGGQTRYWTNAMGMPVAASDPTALSQDISAHNSPFNPGIPATNDGLMAFKMRTNYCGTTAARNALGLKN